MGYSSTKTLSGIGRVSGTVSITNGTKDLTGSSTYFLDWLGDDKVQLADDVWYELDGLPTSDTVATLKTNYTGTTMSGSSDWGAKHINYPVRIDVMKNWSIQPFAYDMVANDVVGTYVLEPAEGAHWWRDSTNTITSDDGSNLATCITLANELKIDYEAHRVLVSTNEHDNGDAINTIAADNASDQATLETLLNELKTDYNAHLSQASIHYHNDTTNTVASANASDLATAITLVNELKTDYEAHRQFVDWECYSILLNEIHWDAGNNEWVMIYSGATDHGLSGYWGDVRIGRATSPNLTNGGTWTRDANNPLVELDWPTGTNIAHSTGMFDNTAVDGKWYLIYTCGRTGSAANDWRLEIHYATCTDDDWKTWTAEGKLFTTTDLTHFNLENLSNVAILDVKVGSYYYMTGSYHDKLGDSNWGVTMLRSESLTSGWDSLVMHKLDPASSTPPNDYSNSSNWNCESPDGNIWDSRFKKIGETYVISHCMGRNAGNFLESAHFSYCDTPDGTYTTMRHPNYDPRNAVDLRGRSFFHWEESTGIFHYWTDNYVTSMGTMYWGSANPYHTISCMGNCRDDFGDLRITDSSDASLYYFVQHQVDGEYASVWINVEELPNENGECVIKFLYGTETVTESDGSNTFKWFDDFSGGLDTGSNWTKVGTATVTDGVCSIGDVAGEDYITTQATYGPGHSFLSQSNRASSSSSINLMMSWNAATNYRGISKHVLRWFFTGGNVGGVAETGEYEGCLVGDDNTYWYLELKCTPDGYGRYLINNCLHRSEDTAMTTSNSMRFRKWTGTNTLRVHWAAIRKCLREEPSWRASTTNVDSDFISSLESMYEPTITTASAAGVDFITSSEVIYQPTVTSMATVDMNFISTYVAIGSDVIDRASTLPSGFTYIDVANPSGAEVTLTKVRIWSDVDLTGCKVGTFYSS